MNTVLPLLALRSFVEAGRYGSLKRAAEAMGVTPGAVSQQIRQLEQRVGRPLFRRTRYGVQLTEPAAEVHAMMLKAFDDIGGGLATLTAIDARQTLTVSTVPSFAASWLVPRLGRFMERHPDIEVRVEASSDVVDLRQGRVDVAIRHGLGSYSGLKSSFLMAPAFLPVGAPGMLAEGPSVREPRDCLAYPLLQDSGRADWPLWFRALGVADDGRAERGPSFDDDFLLMRAAQAGQGLALIRDIYAIDEIASGRLALAIDRPWPTEFAYYAVTTSDALARDPARQFVDWLENEAGKTDSASSEINRPWVRRPDSA